MLAQRLIRQYSLASLLHSGWRLTVFWLSRLLIPTAILSAMGIVVLYSVGAGLFATSLAANGTSDVFGQGVTILRISTIWLLALGLLPMALVFLVVVTARKIPGLQQDLGMKLAVFFLGAALLVVGQGFHLGAFLDGTASSLGKTAFYITGFTLEILVALLYAWANLDFLFSARGMDSLASGKNTTMRRPEAYETDREDERGSLRGDGNGTPQGEKGQQMRTNVRAITVRNDVEVSVSRAEARPHERPSSVASGTSGGTSEPYRMSEFDFPEPPRPLWPLPAGQVFIGPDRTEERRMSGGAQRRSVRFAPSPTSWKRSHPYFPQAYTPPRWSHGSLARANRTTAVIYLQQQLRDYDDTTERGEGSTSFL